MSDKDLMKDLTEVFKKYGHIITEIEVKPEFFREPIYTGRWFTKITTTKGLNENRNPLDERI